MESRKIKLAGMFKEIGAFKVGDFILPSGKKSHTFLDCGLATLNSVVLHQICNDINTVCRTNDVEFNCVGGMSLGADSLVGGLLRVYGLVDKNLSGFLLRKSPNKQKPVEGHLEYGHRVLIVEDVTATGNSVQKVVDVVKNAGATVSAILSVIDRDIGAKQRFESQGLKFLSLLTYRELVELLL